MPSGLEPRRTPVSNSKLKYESLDTNESIAAGDFPTAKKQKQEGVDNRVEPKARHTFKGIGNLVLAMKRFQAALNPRYEYGKQHSSGSTPPPQQHGRVNPSDGSGDEASTGPRVSQQHGQKAHLLFRKLPELPDECGQ